MKMLVLAFEDHEEEMFNNIIACFNEQVWSVQTVSHTLTFQGLEIDEFSRTVLKKEKRIELTYTEFEILNLLARHPGVIFKKEQIYDMVWKEPYFGDFNIIMSHIHNIREKIEDNPGKPFYIQTVWGVGYRFNPNCHLNNK